MELITTLSIIGLFTVFYVVGRKAGNYPLQLLGSLGFIIMGVVSFGTGVQQFSYEIVNATSTVTGNVTTVVNNYGLVGNSLPTANVLGMFLLLIGIGLCLLTYLDSVQMKKSEEDE